MTEKRRRKKSQRRRIVARGRVTVMVALAMAIIFYAAFLAVTVAGHRFGAVTGGFRIAVVIVGMFFLLATYLAIASYCTHRAPRSVYLLLNAAGAVVGVIWAGVQLALGTWSSWLLLDLAGVATAFFVCWVFVYCRSAQKFLQEKELTVKRV